MQNPEFVPAKCVSRMTMIRPTHAVVTDPWCTESARLWKRCPIVSIHHARTSVVSASLSPVAAIASSTSTLHREHHPQRPTIHTSMSLIRVGFRSPLFPLLSPPPSQIQYLTFSAPSVYPAVTQKSHLTNADYPDDFVHKKPGMKTGQAQKELRRLTKEERLI
ncbi:hypothetical protein PHLGIDRAFT_164117 [Phlebiopsis gigantea 11061_1 CR5-6]|uniref:Uncharacterized protein n=1 Tax=Phlebiopsis gigantea (strain 11061_1 CR5-6) TaxID=745531 RepID=A0A0C3S4S4_PHLG1|nr:hypothetical protein PHLGIDRAFT_164117 [Phlebiopsis gigantea 11061_1 CR5-6]